MKKIYILAALIIGLLAACKNTKEDEAEATMATPTADKIDTAWYKAFTDATINYDELNKKSMFKQIAADHVITMNKDIVSVQVQYKFAPPDHRYTVAVYSDGNASALFSTPRYKPNQLVSNNEENVRAASKAVLDLTEANIKLFEPAAMPIIPANDDIVMTITLKNGKHLCLKTTQQVIDADTTALEKLFHSFDGASKAMTANYEAATGLQ
jgi:hypothetical protein